MSIEDMDMSRKDKKIGVKVYLRYLPTALPHPNLYGAVPSVGIP